MGCFSYICKECNKPILSTSFEGERVNLFLLKERVVLQEMEGEYDSYGRVFIDGTQRKDVPHPLRKSIKWDIGWSNVCNLHFNRSRNDGIAAIHSKCFNGIPPSEISKDDPNQGWGESMELLGRMPLK